MPTTVDVDLVFRDGSTPVTVEPEAQVIRVNRGEDTTIRLTCVGSDTTARDITGHAFVLSITSDEAGELELINRAGSITDAEGGIAEVELAADDTTGLVARTYYASVAVVDGGITWYPLPRSPMPLAPTAPLIPAEVTTANGDALIIGTPTIEAGNVGQVLAVADDDPETLEWVDQPDADSILPSQGGNSGKVLGTNGTTASWVAQSAGGEGLSFDTAALMAADQSQADDTVCTLKGYHAVGDGGGGMFYYDSTAAGTNDGGLTIAGWKRIYPSRSIDPKWFGAVGDGSTHPLSGYFGSLGAAQAVYPHATALSNEIDGVAIQAAINAIKGSPGDASIRGGEIAFSGGSYRYNVELDLERAVGITFTGLANGAISGTASAGGTLLHWTAAGTYYNPNYSGSAVNGRSSYGLTFRNINFGYSNASMDGVLLEFGHAGGATVAITSLLPAITFSGTTITRPSGSFITDGWRVGHVVRVQGSASNDGNNGTITALTATTITTSGTTWAAEVANFTGTNGLYAAYGDTQFAKFENCHFVQCGAITAGTGARALVGLTSAIFCSFDSCFFGTAERAILIRDFGRGSGVYSNSHDFKSCRFGYHRWSLVNAGQHLDLYGCGFEGLGGVLEAAYYDEHARTTAAVARTFAFASGPKTITASSGDFTADGWTVGMAVKYMDDAGNYGNLGDVTNVTATVLTVDGTVPAIAASVGWEVYNDTEASGAGVSSVAIAGNTITITGNEITRSDGGSFIDDGWVVNETPYGAAGGGYPAVAEVSASTLTLSSAPGDATLTTGYLRGGGGGGPINFHGGWFGDQYRSDSWIKTLGCTGLNLHGVFIDSNARIVWNRDGELTGSIKGCTTSGLLRPYEGILCEGANGITGYDIAGGQGFTVRNRSTVSIANLSMRGNRSIVTGEAHQVIDDTHTKIVQRVEGGMLVTGNLYNPYGTDAAPTNAKLAVEDGDIECVDQGDGFVIKSPNGTRYRIKVANDGSLSTETV